MLPHVHSRLFLKYSLSILVENNMEGTRNSEVKILALIDTFQVSGPTRGLFQIVEGAKDSMFQVIPGMFLVGSQDRSPAVEEATRRGFSFGLVHQRTRFDNSLATQALRLVGDHGISILQSHNYKPAFLAWRLKVRTGLPWVAFSHGYTSGGGMLAFYNALDRWLLRKADRVVAVSQSLSKLLARSGVPPDRIRVIPNCIDPSDHSPCMSGQELRSQFHSRPDGLLVGVIGRFSKEKGHSVFIKAFQSVVRELPEAKGILIGEGPERSTLQKQIKNFGLQGHIVFGGYHQSISPVYAALDLVVIPSYSEGLPNVLLEAWLHKKPVVATAVGGIPEIMDSRWSRWLVPAGDSASLSKAIVEALKSPSLRLEYGVQGEQYVRERFSPSKRVGQVLDVYRELVGN
jgi:glycosyltransferase involved in cell wall biosynthesis